MLHRCLDGFGVFDYYDDETLATKLYERAEEGDATCVSAIIKDGRRKYVLDIMLELKVKSGHTPLSIASNNCHTRTDEPAKI